MTIETDLTPSPYFQSDSEGNYYQVLFKPSVAVQVRELNQLQKMLQNQIEEFGDNILKRGTVIRGCSFNFYNNYNYVKIKDSTLASMEARPSAYLNKFVKNACNVIGYVVNYQDGFETTDPDLKTLYIRYTNSGNSGSINSFASGDLLTVYDQNNSIQSAAITINGTGYSNNDSLVFCSALSVVNTSANVFTAGHIITQATSNASAVITEVNTSIYVDRVVLKIRPQASDLANTSGTIAAWTFIAAEDTYTITDATSGATATVKEVIGSGATGSVVTLSGGSVYTTTITNSGSGYYIAPYVGVKPTSGGSSATLVAQNYLDQIYVATLANSVGSGYAFGVSEGVIYQKGFFVNVEPQVVLVSKYSQYPNNVSVGFSTEESIINSSIDPTLLDNALGEPNYTAPGADRLQLVPTLIAQDISTAIIDTNYLALVEWSQGVPYKQNQKTQYSVINDAMADRMADTAGDFITDKFLVSTTATQNTSLLANTFTVVIDPGTAYINGNKLATKGNFYIDTQKGIDTQNTSPVVSMSYGSYVVVDNIVGFFPFGQGVSIDLYDAAGAYLSSLATIKTGTVAATGNLIGNARIRSLVPLQGQNGVNTSQYKLYLYDIRMNTGVNFSSVKSVFYNGATKGKADPVLVSGSAVLMETKRSDGTTVDKMVFSTGIESPSAISNTSYQYRTFKETGVELANTGVISYTLTDPNEYWPYSGTLTASQLDDILVFPTDNLRQNTQLTGTVSVNTTSPIGTGTTTTFLTDVRAGDYIAFVGNTTQFDVKRVANVASDTSLTFEANTTIVNATALAYRYFPKWVAIPFDTRAGLTGNVDIATRKTLTLDLGMRTNAAANVIVGTAYNVISNNVTVSQKTPNRSLFVKIRPGNNVSGPVSGYGVANGTVAVTNASVNVVGTSTSFTSDFANGDTIEVRTVTNNIITLTNLTINAVTNATFLTLATTATYTSTNTTIRKAGNLQGPWSLGVPDAFRLRNVYMANTSGVNTTSFPVVTDFYIDSNQNQNYYGLSHLTKRKTSSLFIRPDDYLLIEFDAFTTTGTFHHINSYVASNTITRFTNDSLPLANLSSSPLSMNTFEIPELITEQGESYDLANQLDFRPFVVNTAVLSTTVAGATLNPANTQTFNTADKKFPVPGSTTTLDAQEFMGRIDMVIADKSGKLSVVKGHPKTGITANITAVNQESLPIQPVNSILLDTLRIPPYPNISEKTSAAYEEILNKRLVNDELLARRFIDKIITRLLSQSDIMMNQPQGYSMADIGNLERRISDLEYYVGLSLIELEIKDKLIPSTVSSSINRFKFGFFVDDYNDEKYSLTTDQEYKASIANTRIMPDTERIVVGYSNSVVCTCTDFLLVSQQTATGSALPPICVNTATSERKEASATQKGTGAANAYFTDTLDITMASALGNNAGNVNIYLYTYSQFDRMEVYQSTTNTFTTLSYSTANAVPFTNTDIAHLASNSSWFSGISNTNLLQSVQGTGANAGFLKFGGKVSFQHSPSAGRNYRIQMHKGNGSTLWRYRIEYPVNVDCSVVPTDPGPSPLHYNGVLKIVNTASKKFTDLHINFAAVKPGRAIATNYKVITFRATGLMPSTNHQFFVNGIDKTTDCDTTVVDPNAVGLKGRNGKAAQNVVIPSLGLTNIRTNESGQAYFELYLTATEYQTFGKPDALHKNLQEYFQYEIYNTAKNSYAKCISSIIKAVPIVYYQDSGFRGAIPAGDAKVRYNNH